MWPVLIALNPTWAADQPDDPLLEALGIEMGAAMEAWSSEEHPPYYLAYRAVDRHSWTVQADFGALAESEDNHSVVLDTQARVGSMERDNTHRIRDDDRFSRNYYFGSRLPITGPVEAIQTGIWHATNKEIRDAQEAWQKLETIQKIKVAEQYDAPDFSAGAGIVDIQPRALAEIDREAWEKTLTKLSAILDEPEVVLRSRATLSARSENHYFVDSEGSRIREPRV